MDNAAFDIEICRQCQHKDCRYCRFNSDATEKPTTDKSHDNDPLTVESAISILRGKAHEFYEETRCDACPLKDKCWPSRLSCTEMFITNVLSGFIDADGNPAKKRQPQD